MKQPGELRLFFHGQSGMGTSDTRVHQPEQGIHKLGTFMFRLQASPWIGKESRSLELSMLDPPCSQKPADLPPGPPGRSLIQELASVGGRVPRGRELGPWGGAHKEKQRPGSEQGMRQSSSEREGGKAMNHIFSHLLVSLMLFPVELPQLQKGIPDGWGDEKEHPLCNLPRRSCTPQPPHPPRGSQGSAPTPAIASTSWQSNRSGPNKSAFGAPFCKTK